MAGISGVWLGPLEGNVCGVFVCKYWTILIIKDVGFALERLISKLLLIKVGDTASVLLFGLYVGPKTLISCRFITIRGGVRIEYGAQVFFMCFPDLMLTHGSELEEDLVFVFWLRSFPGSVCSVSPMGVSDEFSGYPGSMFLRLRDFCRNKLFSLNSEGNSEDGPLMLNWGDLVSISRNGFRLNCIREKKNIALFLDSFVGSYITSLRKCERRWAWEFPDHFKYI